MGKTIYTVFIAAFVILNDPGFAQDTRTQYPPALIDSYFGVNIGCIHYDFSQKQLQPGYTASAVSVPPTAVDVVFGHRFSKYLSVQLGYMRPVAFVEYKNVNGTGSNYEVGMNLLSLSIKPTLPVCHKIDVTAETGIVVVTRGGFIVINAPGVKDAVYTSLLLGAGLQYRLNKNWQLKMSSSWSPANDKVHQPSTTFFSTGFNYTMKPLPPDRIIRLSKFGFIFPKQMLQIAFTTNALGYGINNFVSKDAHIFWAGAAQVKQGLSLNYQRNIFHNRSLFALDWGGGLSYWSTRINHENFFTLSVYPVFRFNFIRSKNADVYVDYSFGGPSFISKVIIDGKDTGAQFTFQDLMGVGLFAGKKRKVNAEFRIGHYSNGNIFPQNNGVMIPATVALGYTF